MKTGEVRTLLDYHYWARDRMLERVISCKMLNGQPGASVLSQIIQHVVNHASYHRGQVTTLLRQPGAAPPKSTDLISYYREIGVRFV